MKMSVEGDIDARDTLWSYRGRIPRIARAIFNPGIPATPLMSRARAMYTLMRFKGEINAPSGTD